MRKRRAKVINATPRIEAARRQRLLEADEYFYALARRMPREVLEPALEAIVQSIEDDSTDAILRLEEPLRGRLLRAWRIVRTQTADIVPLRPSP